MSEFPIETSFNAGVGERFYVDGKVCCLSCPASLPELQSFARDALNISTKLLYCLMVPPLLQLAFQGRWSHLSQQSPCIPCNDGSQRCVLVELRVCYSRDRLVLVISAVIRCDALIQT